MSSDTTTPLHLLMAAGSAQDCDRVLAELQKGGYAVVHQCVHSINSLRDALQNDSWDVILSNHCKSELQTDKVLALAKDLAPEVPLIILSDDTDVNLAVSLMKSGAADYISVNELPRLVPCIERELREVDMIRQRKQAESERRLSEEKFMKAFHNSPDAIIITRLSDGVILAVNQGYEVSSGYKAEEVLGKSTLEVSAWTSVEERTRLAAILKEKGILENLEYLSRIKDGSLRLIFATQRTIEINGETCVISFNRDITEQKKAEEVILRRNQALQISSQVMTAMTTQLDVDVILKETLRGLLKLTGLECGSVYMQESAGSNHLVFAASEGLNSDQVEKRRAMTLRIGEGPCGEVIASCQPHTRILDPNLSSGSQPGFFDGEDFKIHIIFPITLKDQIIGSICLWDKRILAVPTDTMEVVRQINSTMALTLENARLYQAVQQYADELEERVAERTTQLLAVNQELEAFSYTIAHDLHAPLRAIRNFSRFLREDYASQLDVEGIHLFERIEASTANMQAMIDDLLSLSKLTQKEIDRQKINLSTLAKNIAEEMQQAEPQRQVTWIIAKQLVVEGDRLLLRTMLENLLGNAWKFTSCQPQACIELGVLEPKDPSEKIVYFVRDNGVGFNPSQANELFHVFKRLHSNSQFPGSGIGLASVKRIVHRHGGRIWAEGVVDQGACFYFTLK